MRRFDVRWVPLMIAAGAFVGSALVSSVAEANDEPPPTDQAELVLEPVAAAPAPPSPSPTDPAPTDPSPTDEAGVDAIDVGQGDEETVSGEATDPPFDDIAVIEMVMPETDTPDSGATVETDTDTDTDTDTEADTDTATEATDDPVAAADSSDPTFAETSDGAAALSDHAAPIDVLALDMSPTTEEPEDGHGDHEGGSGGQGNPYRMTFSVIWLDQSGNPIAELDATFATIDWRELFVLSAASQTGKGMPTSATCTYPEGSDVLRCVFDNPGHGSGADGLIVPARPTASYTVTVTWPSLPDWSIQNANGGPYLARDLCPREGDGSGGGHESGGSGEEGGGHESGGGGEEGGGHESGGSGEEGGGHESGGGRGVSCEHVVVLQQQAVAIVPPVVEPEPEVLPPVEAPAAPVVEPEAQPLPPVETTTATEPAGAVASAAAAPRSLPSTGSSISTVILIAILLIVIGSAAAVLPRRTPAG